MRGELVESGCSEWIKLNFLLEIKDELSYWMKEKEDIRVILDSFCPLRADVLSTIESAAYSCTRKTWYLQQYLWR
jgi:hypothetical protein